MGALAAAAVLGACASLAAGTTARAADQPAAARSAATTLCDSQTAPAGAGTFIVQNNEWNSSAPECVTTDGSAGFTVTNSSISNATSGAPGGYPSIYQGCHWGKCSSGGLTTSPVQVSSLAPGTVTTSWTTTQPDGSNVYNAALEMWFNHTPATTGHPDCAELMVWLNHTGSVQPSGTQLARNLSIDGRTYNVWQAPQPSGTTISYTMTTGTTSVNDLDLAPLADDAVSRGYLPTSCYLLDVEAGFELWQGGQGLATNSFSVNVSPGASNSSGGTGTSTPSAPPSSLLDPAICHLLDSLPGTRPRICSRSGTPPSSRGSSLMFLKGVAATLARLW